MYIFRKCVVHFLHPEPGAGWSHKDFWPWLSNESAEGQSKPDATNQQLVVLGRLAGHIYKCCDGCLFAGNIYNLLHHGVLPLLVGSLLWHGICKSSRKHLGPDWESLSNMQEEFCLKDERSTISGALFDRLNLNSGFWQFIDQGHTAFYLMNMLF